MSLRNARLFDQPRWDLKAAAHNVHLPSLNFETICENLLHLFVTHPAALKQPELAAIFNNRPNCQDAYMPYGNLLSLKLRF